jgi:glycosyltransferase involved in cell wall biosynthesis
VSPPRHILMTTDAVGGVWTYATDLARALCQHGYRVTLVTQGPRPVAEQMETLVKIPGLTIEITDIALEWMDPDGDGLSRAHESLTSIVDRVKPDLIHLNSFREATFDFPVPVCVVAHSCVASWWAACRPDRAIDVSWRIYMRKVAAGLEAADAWVAPTAGYRDWIAANYRPGQQGYVIWNGTALPKARIRKEPFVFAAGRLWDEAKNIAVLSQVVSAVDWPVRVAGPMGLEKALACSSRREIFVKLGALPHAQVIAQLRAASIFVSPAIYEPFGLTVLEAAACGCALVLADIPTFRELWENAALFVDPRDPAALRHALQSVCRDPRLLNHLQKRARQRARRYSLDAMVANYRHLYRNMQAPHSPDAKQRAPGFRELHV